LAVRPSRRMSRLQATGRRGEDVGLDEACRPGVSVPGRDAATDRFSVPVKLNVRPTTTWRRRRRKDGRSSPNPPERPCPRAISIRLVSLQTVASNRLGHSDSVQRNCRSQVKCLWVAMNQLDMASWMQFADVRREKGTPGPLPRPLEAALDPRHLGRDALPARDFFREVEEG
jgi:hypothetical protein